MATNNTEFPSDSDNELELNSNSYTNHQINRGRSHSATSLNSPFNTIAFKTGKSCLHQRSFDNDDWSYQSENFNGILKTSRRSKMNKRISHSRSPPLSIMTNVSAGEQPEMALLLVNPADLLASASELDSSICEDYQAPPIVESASIIPLPALNDSSASNEPLIEDTSKISNFVDKEGVKNSTSPITTQSNEDHQRLSQINPTTIHESVFQNNSISNAKLITHEHELGYQSSAFKPATKTNKSPRFVVNLLNERHSTNGVRLLVDGVRFIVDPAMLHAHPNTMLGRMFSSPLNVNRTSDGDYVVGEGISASVFGILLDFYRGKSMRCPSAIPVQDLKDACDYFLIPFSHETVRCNNLRSFLHEISNDGAYELFEHFLEDEVLSQMVKCAQVGERESHIVVLTDDDVIDWDDHYPPQMPENEMRSHIVHNTQMFRFLKYIENREVAKQVLTERGLKKIRIGIEGYPMYKEKIKHRPGSRPEVIYNYAQRPFLRMSWEEEENKSRHVDFQCVKSKSITDLTSLEQVAVERPVDLPHSLTPANSASIHLLPPHAPHTDSTQSGHLFVNTASSGASSSSFNGL